MWIFDQLGLKYLNFSRNHYEKRLENDFEITLEIIKIFVMILK